MNEINENNDIKLYNGDCLEVMDRLIKQGVKVDAIITDPPYKHEKGGRGKMLLGMSLDRQEFNMKELGDFGENEIYNFLEKADKCLKNTNMYVFCSEKQLPYYLNWCGLKRKKFNLLTWNKPLSVMNRERYSTNIEYIVRIYTNGCALNKVDFDTYPEKTIYYSKYKTFNQIRGANKLHPSQKPIEILTQFIELSSNENEIILDPFVGSGSTGVAAINLNRKFIGIELDENYFKIASDRIHRAIQEKNNNID